MGSVSQDFFPSTLFLSLSRSLNRTVTMLFLPRLPLFLAIIFLGLFCLPHTINCKKTDYPDCPDVENKPCMKGSYELKDEYCIWQGRRSCKLICQTAPICNNFRASGPGCRRRRSRRRCR